MGNRQLFDEKSALELLEEFKRSGNNAPFEEIVRRYAAMVFGVCLRVTGDKHDAEDATQAVFLSLALQAKTARQITYVGPWLQKVAHRLALDTKKSKTRRKRREEKLAEQQRHSSGNGRFNFEGGGAFGGGNGHGMNPADAPGAEELKSIMMEELNQLPAKYRMPLVMHYFGGLSREEMATQLGCNSSTLGVRVHRGKAMLGSRLAKRGVAISAIAMTVLLEHVIRESALAPIISTASAASNGLVAGPSFGAAIASAKAIQIVRMTARAVAAAKLRYAVVLLLAISSAAFATGTDIVQTIRSHLPELNLSGWIKPLLKSLVPNLRADANNERDPLDDVKSREVKINIDPRVIDYRAGLEDAKAAASRGNNVTIQHVAAPRAAAQLAQSPEPQLNDIARAILSPAFTPAAIKPATPNSDKFSVDSSDPIAKAAAVIDPVSASGAVFTLGAGGGGGSGKPDIYVMPANASMHVASMTIGDARDAIFRQLGGTNQVNGNLVVAQQKSSNASYEMYGGDLLTQREIIGDEGNGAFIQIRGINIARDGIVVGNAGKGTYQQEGGSVTVAAADTGKDYPDAYSSQGLAIGYKPNSSGKYILAEGSLSADPQKVGVGGNGQIVQSGGTNKTDNLLLGQMPGSSGSYELTGGKLVFHPADPNITDPQVAISIGVKGTGTFTFGNSNKTGSITQVGQYGASVVVRGQPTAEGAIRGWGKLNLPGVFVNNGQVIADGYRQNRTLDLSSFARVTSSIENPRWGGTNGWFARRRGELKLPAIAVKAGTDRYTWGEDDSDPMLDLVNSVRFKIENSTHDGDVSIALLSPLRTDIPRLPQGHHWIGVWSFDASSLGGFDAVDLQVRYDDAAAAAMGLNEEILKLWRYDTHDEQWHRIMDNTFSRDVTDHLIMGRAPGQMGYFAVSAPEPGAGMLLIAAGMLALRRRRRTG